MFLHASRSAIFQCSLLAPLPQFSSPTNKLVRLLLPISAQFRYRREGDRRRLRRRRWGATRLHSSVDIGRRTDGRTGRGVGGTRRKAFSEAQKNIIGPKRPPTSSIGPTWAATLSVNSDQAVGPKYFLLTIFLASFTCHCFFFWLFAKSKKNL